MLDKQQLTQQLLDQLPPDDRVPFQVALRSWWLNSHDNGGLRLSPIGMEVFARLQVTPYEFEFVHALSPSLLLSLSRKLDCPYYIKGGKTCRLTMFGSEQAVLFAMYGDLKKFLTYLDRT